MKVFRRIVADESRPGLETALGTVPAMRYVDVPIGERACGLCRWHGRGPTDVYPYQIGDPCPSCGAPDEHAKLEGAVEVLVRHLRVEMRHWAFGSPSWSQRNSLRRDALQFALGDLTRRQMTPTCTP